jgi:hypothetical protein
MFIYMPNIYSCDRVVWSGGESTQLHYEQEGVDKCDHQTWIEKEVRTLGNGIPAGMSEMHAELVNFYNHCQTLE